VSPGYTSEIGKHCLDIGLPLLPGVSTGSEVMMANNDGYYFLKLFPAVENGLSGIDEQQREIAKNAQATADASKKAYENSSLQENSLRLQGKSEKEILQIKMKKLETSIKDAKVNLEIQEKQAESQIAASKRNAELLQQIVRGALELSAVGLRMLVAPIDLVLVTANKVSKALGFGEITAVNLNDEITKLTEAGSKLVTELLIDPAKQEKELAEGQESRIMDELSKMRQALSAEEDKQNRYVLDLLEDKKVLLRECEELRCQLGAKTVQYMDLERRSAEGREQRRLLEDQIGLIKKDLNSLTRLNRDALE
jgi:hypothetical protein